MIVKSIAYYRKKLGLSQEDVVSREPGKMRHHEHYTTARGDYTSGKWLESAVLIEKAIDEYKHSLNDCYMLCDDINVINITGDDVSPEKDEKLEEYDILPDSLEYYELLRSIILSYLKCRSDCRIRAATADGEFFDKYLPGHFHYLQFNYFKCELSKLVVYCKYSAYKIHYTIIYLTIQHYVISIFDVISTTYSKFVEQSSRSSINISCSRAF